jgi:ABC-2 type transport system ATP-binding protein
VVECFTETASVLDEGRTYHGREEILGWREGSRAHSPTRRRSRGASPTGTTATAYHLVLLREGRVRLSGGIDALLAAHHVVTGPASPAGLGAGVIHQSTAGRQTTALVRAAEPPQGFRADPATLDALVLAYLQQTMPDDRGRAA